MAPRVVAWEAYELSCALGAECVDAVYPLGLVGKRPEEVLEAVRKTVAHEQVDVLIPNNDLDVGALAPLGANLSEMGISSLLPSVSALDRRAKSQLPRFAAEFGYTAPRTTMIVDASQWDAVRGSLSYPMMLKGCVCDNYLVENPDEAETCASRIVDVWGYPLLAQEVIEGEEWAVAAVADRASRTVGAVAVKKLGITEHGKTWAAVTVQEQQLLRLTRLILSDFRWVGPVEIEFIVDRNDVPHVLEINPRLPSWVQLATRAGQNLPALVMQLALGEWPRPQVEYTAGITMMRVASDVVLDIGTVASFVLQCQKGLNK